VVEALREALHPGSVLPAQIEGEAVHRLPVRAPLELLQHHHRCHDARWDRAPSPIGEQVGEGLVGEELVPLAVQQRVDRRLAHQLLAEPAVLVEDVELALGLAQGHWGSSREKVTYLALILQETRADREHLRRKTPGF